MSRRAHARDRAHALLMSAIDAVVLAWENTQLAAQPLTTALTGALGLQARRTAARPLAWATLYAALLCLLGYLVIDRPLAFWFKAHIGGDAEGFWKTVTRLGEAHLYLVPAGLLFAGFWLASLNAAEPARRLALRRLAAVPGFVFAAVAVSGLIGRAVKYGLGRYRPRALFDENLYGFAWLSHGWLTNSFPSGHTQAAFAAMTALTLVWPRYDIAFIAIAVLVGLSRVLTTVHYFSDAIGGAWLGVMVTVLLHRWLSARGIEIRRRPERDRRLLD